MIEVLRGILGEDGVTTDAHDLERVEHGWRYGHGKAAALAFPTSTGRVRDLVVWANQNGVRLQPIGANTGLTGAGQPDDSGEMVVVSFERLNRRIDIDPIDGTAVVDAGVLLSQLNETLESRGLWFPIDLGADPQIGGMVVTNTGGSRLVKYGDVRSRLLGLEVVLPDGEVVSQLAPLRKNNTGLDWKQMFVGTSGVYGFVTAATVQLAPRPRQFATALVGAADGAAVLRLLGDLDRGLGDFLSAYEVISQNALEVTLRHGSNLRTPFRDSDPAFAVLVELSSTIEKEQLDLEEQLESAIVAHVESEAEADREGLVDVLVGRGEDFWSIRHQISESLREEGEVLAFDLSVPRSKLAEFTDAVTERIHAAHDFVRVCDFGHWGDGGTHLNLVWPKDRTPEDRETFWKGLQTLVYDTCVRDFSGSFSAEHGVGPHNIDFYRRYVPETVRSMNGALATRGRFGQLSLD